MARYRWIHPRRQRTFEQYFFWNGSISNALAKQISLHILIFNRIILGGKKMLQMTDALVEDARGDYLVGITDLHPGADGLVSLRGPEGLCMDLFDSPDMLLSELKPEGVMYYVDETSSRTIEEAQAIIKKVENSYRRKYV